MVYYRKYRPQTISELDSKDVREKLHAVLKTAAPTFIQVPHAFLFTGPKGLGKTSTARIVAKVINCAGRKDTTGKDIEPCNTCDQCISITNGTNMDILEIDAASNRGIDEMRDLKEKIKLSPLSAKKKVYIIDEVHMLTTEAFNALLKTLEEPPAHAVFILCTTEMHKIPATILSRCMHLSFHLATEEELVRAFERIVKGEDLKVEKNVLKDIAKLADGGFRDGTKILEELVSLSSGKEITSELLEMKYHTQTLNQAIKELLTALEKKESKKCFATVQSLVAQGADIQFFLTELVETLHSLLLTKVGVGTGKTLTTSLEVEELKRLIELFSEAIRKTKYAVIPQLPLELACVSWCEGEEVTHPQQVTRKEEAIIKQTVKEAIKDDVTLSSLRKQVGDIAKNRALYGEDPANKPSKEKVEKGSPAEVSVLEYRSTGDQTPEWVDALWKNIILSMKEHNHMIAGVLRSCRIISYDRKVLIIQSPSSFHKDRLEEAKTKGVLEQICHKLVGNPIAVTIELKS